MHIAIIGAGFTGLTAAKELVKAGHTVTVFEKEKIPGGLAIGFKKDEWEWSLEKHYHHIFESDAAIRELADEIGVKFTFTRPNTSSLVEGDILQLDAPSKLLMFSKLSIIERIRMGMVLAYLKYIADWKTLEGETTHAWCIQMMGRKPYEMLWEPLMIAKFGPHYKSISLSWFWARIKARTTNLGYPTGGFQHLAEKLASYVIDHGGTINYDTSIDSIQNDKKSVTVSAEGTTHSFDIVLVTVPNVFFAKMAPSLPSDYQDKLRAFKGIGALNMVLELDAPFFKNDVYWLSICEKEYPFLAVVEHTHFVDTSHYDGKHLLYVGNYLPQGHEYFTKTKEELLDIYDPYLKRLNSEYKSHIKDIITFPVPFAQPVVTANFSKQILPFKTPLKHVYLANMQQVYPWDRGTNFAVEMGSRVAEEISETEVQ